MKLFPNLTKASVNIILWQQLINATLFNGDKKIFLGIFNLLPMWWEKTMSKFVIIWSWQMFTGFLEFKTRKSNWIIQLDLLYVEYYLISMLLLFFSQYCVSIEWEDVNINVIVWVWFLCPTDLSNVPCPYNTSVKDTQSSSSQNSWKKIYSLIFLLLFSCRVYKRVNQGIKGGVCFPSTWEYVTKPHLSGDYSNSRGIF